MKTCKDCNFYEPILSPDRCYGICIRDGEETGKDNPVCNQWERRVIYGQKEKDES